VGLVQRCARRALPPVQPADEPAGTTPEPRSPNAKGPLVARLLAGAPYSDPDAEERPLAHGTISLQYWAAVSQHRALRALQRPRRTAAHAIHALVVQRRAVGAIVVGVQLSPTAGIARRVPWSAAVRFSPPQGSDWRQRGPGTEGNGTRLGAAHDGAAHRRHCLQSCHDGYRGVLAGPSRASRAARPPRMAGTSAVGGAATQ
jgi:hypothetical protein